MHAFRREDAPLYLTAAAAVCTVISIAAFEILMGLALVAFILTRQKWRVPPLWLPFAVFVAGTMLSEAVSGHLREGFPQIKKFYVYLMLFLVAAAFRNVRQIRWLGIAWALAASLSAAWALKQFAYKVRAAQAAHEDFYASYVGSRITGFMSHWMTFSGGMMIALLVIGSIVFYSTDRRWTGWLIGAAVLISVALLAAYTRSMEGAAAVGGVYLIWFWRRWVVLAVPVLIGILIIVNPFHTGDRIESVFFPNGDTDSNAHREMCRRIGYRMIQAHPWLGIGPEQVQYQYLQYLPAGTSLPLPSGDYGHLHNDYIHYAAELGVPTMLAMMWMFGRALFDFARGLRGLSPAAPERWVLHAAIAVIIAILLAGWFEKNLGDSEVLSMFLAVIGCGYVALETVSQNRVEEACKV
jgi:putative inorganic carbon (HCO3(-)) transporter